MRESKQPRKREIEYERNEGDEGKRGRKFIKNACEAHMTG